MVNNMLFAKKIKNNLFLPVLLVILVLSIESMLLVILEFLIISIRQIDSNLFSHSNEFQHLTKMIISKGITILVLIFIFNKKLRNNEIKLHSDIKSRRFLIIVILLYVGCTTFLLENLNSSLLIISDTTEIIKVWPEIVMSKIAIENIDYQLLLILLITVIIPIFEEFLYRKAIIQALLQKRFRMGWIIIISSLIYGISPFLSNLVEYSEEQAIWDFSIRVVSGLILAVVFLKTQKIRYPILLKVLVNFTIYFHYLTRFHPIISQFREFYNISLFLFASIGIFLFFYIVLDGVATYWSTLSMPPWFEALLDFQFYKDGQFRSMILTILVFLPLLPLGFVLFIDHTILYSDFWGSLVKTVIKSVLLGTVIFICGMQLISNHSLFEAYPEPNATIKSTFRDFFFKIRNRIVIRDILVLIIFLLVVISPIFFIDMSATVFTSVPLLGRIIEVNMKITSGQNPFMSYSRVEVSSRSPLFPMLLIQRTIEEMFYFLKHTNGQWYFLPDTFMSNKSDWLHGLVTVGTWFLFLFLLYFAIYSYFNHRKIVAGFSAIAAIVTELLWYLLTLGFGSISLETAPPTPSADQTLSEFIKMDFEMNWLVIIPLGLIFLFLAAIFFLVEGFWGYRQEKEKKKKDDIEDDEDED